MITFWSILLIICFLFLFSGLLFGFALFLQKYQRLRGKCTSLSDECDTLEQTLRKQATDYAALNEVHEKTLREFTVLKNRYIQQNSEIRQLSTASIALQSATMENFNLKSGTSAALQKIRNLKGEINILSMQLTVKQNKITELEKYRGYYEKFVELSELTLKLRDYNTRLKNEIIHLRSIGISLDHFGKNSQPMVFKKTDNPAAIYHAVLGSTASHKNSRGSVISDDMGFTIASNSEFADELAGISVLYQYCEDIINKNIHFSKLSKVIFINDNDLCLTLFPLVINDQTVYFSGLSQGLIDIKPLSPKVSEAIVIN
jgi:hypothetical protein